MHQDQLPGTFFGPSTLVHLLRHRARYQPDDTAFVYLVDGEHEQVELTYKELDRQARAIAAWLQQWDLEGERALLLYPAGLEFIAAFFGCLYAGVVAVPVYPPRRNRSMTRIQAIADDAEAKVALTTDTVLNRVEPLIDETPHLKELTWLATCRVPAGIEQQWESPEIRGDTLAFLQYTSGSTGTPKGVMLTHANLVHNSALISHGFEHTRSKDGVFWLPSYHDMGLIGGILQPVYLGRPNVLMSPMSFLQKPYRWLAAISRFRATTSGGPNFAYDLCVRKVTPEQRATLDLSSWDVAFNGAEPVRAETIEQFCEAFEPCGFRREAFYPCFGLAEATLIVSGGYLSEPPVIRTFEARSLVSGRVVDAEPDDEGVRALVGCGQGFPDQQLVIADPKGLTRCLPGQVGEIWVHGPSVAMGYWQRPEVTRTMFQATLKDTGEGPFLRTGDLGFLLDGELFVTGRLKDLIIFRGVNHYPQDIEHTAHRAHARLRPDCGAAFTVEEDGQEKLVIVNEVERHKTADLDAICEQIHREVATEHELSVDVIVLIRAGSVPKTSSNKIQRHACREGYLGQTLDVVCEWRAEKAQGEALGRVVRAAAVEAPATDPDDLHLTTDRGVAARKRVTESVLDEIRRVGKERVAGLALDTPIVQTGLDSLERMEILAGLEERFGGRFPEDVLPDLETANDVIAAVEKYLGTTPREKVPAAGAKEIPSEHYCIEEFPECVRMKQSLSMLSFSGLRNPFFNPLESGTTNVTRLGGREVVNFASYNYLCMSGDPRVNRAVKEAVDRYGSSASASRLVGGEKVIHQELEREIADFLGTEASLCLYGGHATNETVIGHLFGPGDLILHDGLAHNSIVQGCILSGARRRPFPHNDWQAADDLLRDYRHEYRRVLIVIEGAYSMDGDTPDLPRFVEVAKRHKTLMMIDEAHSFGTIGATGRGIAEHCGGVARDDVDIWMGTLSKAMGSGGGFIAGHAALIDYLKYTTPGFVFSAAMTPPAAAAALASLRLLRAEPDRVARLQDNSALFLSLTKKRGLNTGMSNGTPIIPIILGSSIHCLQLSDAMLKQGVNVLPILHPAVEETAARLRFFITSQHTEEQIRRTVDVLATECEKIRP
ncbi:MAG: aminotransferase class I/II-fold pyridoxal phosphate-dependent enzyme, partial [Patescibacteria group bacterium]|nr:aminotransferase class I/II-fold pyridoxal phosphate-dependent enzyme [Patescibacteria group bacterium]